MADVFGHLHRHAGVVQAHDRNAGRQTQRHQRIDASADVENALELRLLVDELLRWRPDHGIVGKRRPC